MAESKSSTSRVILSIGDIIESRFWLAIETRAVSGPSVLDFGPTYRGTRAGVVAVFRRWVLLAHYRPTGGTA